MASLSKTLRQAGYDLIGGPVRNHKTLQLWLKQNFNEAELYYSEVAHAFVSSVPLKEEVDPALSVDATKTDDYAFNIGISLLEEILKSIGMGAFELSAKIKSGKKVTIGYNNSVTKVIPTGDLTDFFASADFTHPNSVLLKNANRNNILVITGIVSAQNLVAEIETDFDLDGDLVTSLNKAADGKLGFSIGSTKTLKMVSEGNIYFPVAVKANRLDFDRGKFKGMHLVTDDRNLF